MRNAETVTFGGSGLDRAAHLRGQPDRIAALLADAATRVVALWRGRPLVAGAARDRLGWVEPGHPVLKVAGARAVPVFLGLDTAADGTTLARFAMDVSAWVPEGHDPAVAAAFYDPTEFAHPSLPDDHRFAELRSVMVHLDAREAEMVATAKAILGWHDTHGFCARCGVASVVAMAGWQRTCPACGGQHFPRTDPVVIMLVTSGNSVLMGRSPGWPEGMYSLLAGFVEPGETVEAAVRREVLEEAGVKVGAVRYLASQPWPFPASLMIGCHGEALDRAITIDPAEIEDARWLTREQMVAVMAGGDPVIKPSRRGAIAHFLIANWLADQLE